MRPQASLLFDTFALTCLTIWFFACGSSLLILVHEDGFRLSFIFADNPAVPSSFPGALGIPTSPWERVAFDMWGCSVGIELAIGSFAFVARDNNLTERESRRGAM